jgi:Flp pilus assembly pilin Flp
VIISNLKAFWQEEDGQDMVEYSLLLAFIALAAVALLTGIQGNVKSVWTAISNAMTDAATSATTP